MQSDPVHTRRDFLARGTAAMALAATGVARSAGPARDHALTITYPAGAAAKFDAAYYRDHHAKLFMDIYGSCIERFELRQVESPQAPFLAVINVWIADFEVFHARSTAAAYQRMGDDKKNFTNLSSTVEVDVIRHAAGEPRNAIGIGTASLNLLFPMAGNGHWGDAVRCRHYADGLRRLLGPAAVRRIEVRQGVQLLDDGAPTYEGGVNLYARDAQALATAWTAHRSEADALAAQLSAAQPLVLDTRVYGVDRPAHGT